MRFISFIYKYKHHFIFLFFFSIGIILFSTYNSYQELKILTYTIELPSYFHNKQSIVKNYLNLREENIKLQKENTFLHNLLIKKKDTTSNLLNYIFDTTIHKEYIFINASVIYSTTHINNNYLIIDKGNNQGIKKGMGVISSEGIIGIISNVSKNYSKVLLILNTQIKISAQHNKSKYFGFIYWDHKNPTIVSLINIPDHIKIEIGDTISTTGFDQIFPSHFPIGKIISIKQKNTEHFYDLKIKLFVDFRKLNSIYIVNIKDKLEIQNLKSNQ